MLILPKDSGVLTAIMFILFSSPLDQKQEVSRGRVSLFILLTLLKVRKDNSSQG